MLRLLSPAPGEVFLDGTAGAGGHAEEIARRIGPGGILVCADADPGMLVVASERLGAFPCVRLVHADYADFPKLRDATDGRPFDGMFLDLGISSLQLDDPSRGFSFREDGPDRADLAAGRAGETGDPQEGVAEGHPSRHAGVPGAPDRGQPGAGISLGLPRRVRAAPGEGGEGCGDQLPLARRPAGEDGLSGPVGGGKGGAHGDDPQTGYSGSGRNSDQSAGQEREAARGPPQRKGGKGMQRIVVGNGVCMITEIRKETPVFPAVPRRRRLMVLFVLLLALALFNVWLSGQYYRMGD